MAKRCAMCYLERDESKMRPVIKDHPVRLCGKCSIETDRALGFLESIGVYVQLELTADLAIAERLRAEDNGAKLQDQPPETPPGSPEKAPEKAKPMV